MKWGSGGPPPEKKTDFKTIKGCIWWNLSALWGYLIVKTKWGSGGPPPEEKIIVIL